MPDASRSSTHAAARAGFYLRPATRGDWLLSLASFNLGIEAFQVLLVCALVPLMAFGARLAWSGAAARVASFAILAAGVGWFFGRVIAA